MPIEIQDREARVRRVEWGRGFRVEVHWESSDGDSETGSYYVRTWVSPYLPDDVETPRTRRALTNDVCEMVIENILEEKAQDDGVFTDATFHEMTEVRKVTVVGGDG